MKRFFSSILFIGALALFFVAAPPQASAAPWWPIVPCGLNAQPKDANGIEIPKTGPDGHDYTQPCNQCLLLELGENLIDLTIVGVVPMVGTLFFLWAGFLILWGGKDGDPGAVKKGQHLVTQTAIGIAILLSSWLIANFLLKTLANDDVANKWYQIECRTGDLKDLVDTTVPRNNPDPQDPPDGSGPVGPGGKCLMTGVNLCQAKTMTCSNSLCGQYVNSINKHAGGAATANLLKAVMMKESSCDATKKGPPPNPGKEQSFGLMQLIPSTAKMYAYKCGVASGTVIDGNWLTNPTNSDTVVCMGAEYLRALAGGICGSSVRNIAAGYNAGPTGGCSASVACAGEKGCSNEPMRRWECLYDDAAHTRCNGGNDITKGLNQTRDYATKILHCVNNPGF